ncbi:MarR family winged helix-turn-helix transcriptional regulator [Glaciimonas soli]|nr:MarR family transcriptional regulator [Glaciimonas soli]
MGLETRIESDDHLALRVCLRLLSCATQMENEVRKHLRIRSGISLARFDYLAQLHRHPEGLTMSAISRCLMVTGGNVTGLTNELESEGLVSRSVDSNDRRTYHVRLTPKGRRMFKKIAAEHEAWVVDMFSGLGDARQEQLHRLLGELRQQLSIATQSDDEEKIER